MITAKLRCTSKEPAGQRVENPEDQQWLLTFGPDYADGANTEWAFATPALSLSMTVRASVADRFSVGQPVDAGFTMPDGHADDADRTPADDVTVPPGTTAEATGRGDVVTDPANPTAEGDTDTTPKATQQD